MSEIKAQSTEQLLSRIEELENRLEETEHLIDAIKAGEVDAFAINNGTESEIFTLQSADYTYRLLIEEFGEGAINVAEDGMIIYTNTSFFELLKLPYDRVIGSSIFDLIHPGSLTDFKRLFEISLTGKSKGEVNLAVNNVLIPVYISLTSLRPNLDSVGMIITDFTEKKKTDRIILDYQSDLESKNLELVQNNEELASFVYIASHDLQEPLRKIQTFASRLLENEIGNLSEGGKDIFDRMQVAAKRMQTLIDDLLIYSRTNSIERKFENIDVSRIIEEVKAELKEEIQEKAAVIETISACEAHIIHFQFRQLFLNLLSNSLKFIQPGRPPHIIISSEIASGADLDDPRLSADQKYCHISISDNGIGFEQQYNEKIFNVFVRLHGRTEYKGTGIGLAIVKKIADNHHGFIKAKGEPGTGATFDIYIPAG